MGSKFTVQSYLQRVGAVKLTLKTVPFVIIITLTFFSGACMPLSMTGASDEVSRLPVRTNYYLKDGSGKAIYLAGYPSVYLAERPGGGNYQAMHSALQQYGVN
ncbi:MAG: hypothetical protein PHT33_05810, partial [bacterium]|nr:hypothetical protein [bacterium]